MFHKKPDRIPNSVAVSIFRVVHILLILHAAAIVGITFFFRAPVSIAMTPEHIFSLAVAIPLVMGSLAFLLATMVRALYTTGIFFCSLLALFLACLPMMMNVFFPMHLLVFGLAAVYAASCVVLAFFFFAQPVPKKR